MAPSAPLTLPAVGSGSALSPSNLAVAERSPLIVAVHVPVPEQAPDQPTKDDPGEAVAVSLTGIAANGAEQVEPQLIPLGLEVTLPEPLPVLVTVSVLPL